MSDNRTVFSIPKAAGIIAVFSLLSRLVGLYRDRLFAGRFGAGDLLDSYYAAFRLPDFIFNLLILGTLSVAFIPVFTEYYFKNHKEANRIASTIITLTFGIMIVLSLILMLFVPEIIKIIAPGFEGQKYNDTITLTRILLISPVIFSLSSIFASILNSLRRFFVAALAPVLYNIGIIFGAVYLYPRFGINGLAYGVILGAILHMLAQLVDAQRSGFVFKPNLDFRHPAVQKIKHLFLPRIFGVDNAQIGLLIASAIGSLLAAGSLTIFSFAHNLQSVPIGIFGAAFAIAAFPALSEHFASDNSEKFNQTIRDTLLNIIFLIVPAVVLMFVLKYPIVNLLNNGEFRDSDVIVTAQVLGVFSLSIWAQAINPLLSRSFYARQNTKTPVLTGLFALIIGAILSYALASRMGIVGVAIGFTFAEILNFSLLTILLRRSLNNFSVGNMFMPLIKIIIAALVSGVFAFILAEWINPTLFGDSFISRLVYLLIIAGAAFGLYLIFGKILGVSQAQQVSDIVKRRIFR
jgi:putative peptidoglycan lipid II flippase